MRPWDTESAMYSKCIVSPLMRTPIAMMASNGAVEEGSGVVEEMEREGRSVVEEPRRSPAVREEVPVVVDWIWEAEYSLGAWLVCLRSEML